MTARASGLRATRHTLARQLARALACFLVSTALGCASTQSVTREAGRTRVSGTFEIPPDGGLAASLESWPNELAVRLTLRRDCVRIEAGSVQRATATTTRPDPAATWLQLASGVTLAVSSGLVLGNAMPDADPHCIRTEDGCVSSRGGAVVGGTLLALTAVPLLASAVHDLATGDRTTVSVTSEPYDLRQERQACGAAKDLEGSMVLLDDEVLGFPSARVDASGLARLRLAPPPAGAVPRTRRLVLSEPSAGAARLASRDLVLARVELPGSALPPRASAADPSVPRADVPAPSEAREASPFSPSR
ncbi:MAG: hypothetical protein FJ095_11515 [Deltaproteobacteria bacterium]|nr:hypothetical protein [Deltaproteobacteria bacterium]